MKKSILTGRVLIRIAIAIAVSLSLSGCSDGDSFDKATVNSLDLCVEREDYHISRSMLPVEPIAKIKEEKIGVWVRRNAALAWSIENVSIAPPPGGMWSSIPCDGFLPGERIEAFACQPVTAGMDMIAEAFENRATGTNLAGINYKVSSCSGDLAVGASITASGNVKLRMKPVLAKVGFTVSVNVDNRERKITATADDRAGSFKLDDGNILIINSVSLIGRFYGEGVVNMLSGNWAVPDRAGSVFVGDDYIGGGKVTSAFVERFTLTADDFRSRRMMGSDAVSRAVLNGDDNYIYLIPQECADRDAVCFSVEYTLINPSGCALTFTETSPSMELAFAAGESQLFDITFDFSTIVFNPTTTSWR